MSFDRMIGGFGRDLYLTKLIFMQQKNLNRNGLFKTVLLTGLLAGTLDITSAYITVTIKSGKFPATMFNYIAGGVLGLDTAMHGGNAAAFLGLFFHYFIAMSWTVFFFLVFPRLRFLWYNRYLVGMLYAVFVNLVMGQVILRLTPLPRGPFSLGNVFTDWLVFGVIFGIPIAYSAYRYYGVDTSAAAVAAGDR
jgi:hypothetical protein